MLRTFLHPFTSSLTQIELVYMKLVHLPFVADFSKLQQRRAAHCRARRHQRNIQRHAARLETTCLYAYVKADQVTLMQLSELVRLQPWAQRFLPHTVMKKD